MRRTGFFAGLSILALIISIANAQGSVMFRGIPASVTSIRPNNPTPGIPPSVTSPIQVPSGQFDRPFFISNSPTPLFHHHHHFVPVPVPVPVYYPYYSYPVPEEAPPTYEDQQQQPQQPVVEVIEAPAPTIFENRPGYQAPPARPSEPSTAAPSSSDNSTAPANQPTGKKEDLSASEAEPTTILVFRDGRMIEIGNYAIVGDTLYNLTGNYQTHKILLADLDLDKTAKINEDRGYDFRLPKQQGN